MWPFSLCVVHENSAFVDCLHDVNICTHSLQLKSRRCCHLPLLVDCLAERRKAATPSVNLCSIFWTPSTSYCFSWTFAIWPKVETSAMLVGRDTSLQLNLNVFLLCLDLIVIRTLSIQTEPVCSSCIKMVELLVASCKCLRDYLQTFGQPATSHCTWR